jgi:hypothetical protein
LEKKGLTKKNVSDDDWWTHYMHRYIAYICARVCEYHTFIIILLLLGRGRRHTGKGSGDGGKKCFANPTGLLYVYCIYIYILLLLLLYMYTNNMIAWSIYVYVRFSRISLPLYGRRCCRRIIVYTFSRLVYQILLIVAAGATVRFRIHYLRPVYARPPLPRDTMYRHRLLCRRRFCCRIRRRCIVKRGPRSCFKIFSVRAREMPHVTLPHPTNTAVPLLSNPHSHYARTDTHTHTHRRVSP